MVPHFGGTWQVFIVWVQLLPPHVHSKLYIPPLCLGAQVSVLPKVAVTEDLSEHRPVLLFPLGTLKRPERGEEQVRPGQTVVTSLHDEFSKQEVPALHVHELVTLFA